LSLGHDAFVCTLGGGTLTFITPLKLTKVRTQRPEVVRVGKGASCFGLASVPCSFDLDTVF